MRNKLRFFALLALAFMAPLGAFVWWSMPPKEPTYKGKPLSYWLRGYDWSGQSGTSTPSHSEADEAARAIGTNAIPTLLRMLQRHDSPFMQRFSLWVKRQKIHKINWQYRSAQEDGDDAMRAFQLLGLDAGDLKPQLTRIYALNPSSLSRQYVLAIATYTSTDSLIWSPFFLNALQDTNDFILRADAAVALVKIRTPPDVAVPALIRALKDPYDAVRTEAMYSLAKYGADAEAALPELQKIIADETTKGNSSTNSALASPVLSGRLAWGFCFGDTQKLNKNGSRWSPFNCNLLGTANESLSKINYAISNPGSTIPDYLPTPWPVPTKPDQQAH